jgi:hypothetical protein
MIARSIPVGEPLCYISAQSSHRSLYVYNDVSLIQQQERPVHPQVSAINCRLALSELDPAQARLLCSEAYLWLPHFAHPGVWRQQLMTAKRVLALSLVDSDG